VQTCVCACLGVVCGCVHTLLRMRSISDQVCPSLARVLSQSLFEEALNVRPNLSLCLFLSRAQALSRALSLRACVNTLVAGTILLQTQSRH
jgi:hypothetical protein